MAVEKDLFGFDELAKSLKRITKRIPEKSEAILTAYAQATAKATKQKTPVHKGNYTGRKKYQKNGDLKKSWRTQKVKKYLGEKYLVARVRSTDSKAHLIEDGHKIFTTRGKLKKKIAQHSNWEKMTHGIKTHGRTEGVKMLDKSIKEAERAYFSGIEKMLEQAIAQEDLGE